MDAPRIVSVERAPFSLPLRLPVGTARSTHTLRRGWLIRAVDSEGQEGWGEATPLPSQGTEEFEVCDAALAQACEGLLLHAPTRAAHHGLELARLDLSARRARLPLRALLGAQPRETVAVNALLTAASPDALAEEARFAVAGGFSTLKVKVGALPLAQELERLQALRRAVGPRPALRLDANGAWSEAVAREALRTLAPFDLSLCEEPTPGFEAIARLQRDTSVPLGLDESLGAAALEQPVAPRVVVLKPMVRWGLMGSLQFAKRAQVRGSAVVVTTTLDGVVARAAALELALALEQPPLACGLATGSLLAEDVAADPRPPVRGEMRGLQGPGLSSIDLSHIRWSAR